jgi:hypothetical protein
VSLDLTAVPGRRASPMIYRDDTKPARARQPAQYQDQPDVLVLALPRGGLGRECHRSRPAPDRRSGRAARPALATRLAQARSHRWDHRAQSQVMALFRDLDKTLEEVAARE